MWRFLALFFLVSALLIPAADAHPGSTDGMGGHYDNATGIYHFHHGYPAHHHPDGVCPYDSSRLYPTDPPSKASGTTRPTTVSENSGSSLTSRFYFPSTGSTVKPTSTPLPELSSHKPSVSNYVHAILAALFGLPLLYLLLIHPWVADAKKRKRKIKPAAKSIMEAKPGDTFRTEPKAVTIADLPTAPAPSVPEAVSQMRPRPAPIRLSDADPSLIKVSIEDRYLLRILFSNSEVRFFDAFFLTTEPGYEPLLDYQLFQHFYISSSRLLLYWDHFNITINAKRLYQESVPLSEITAAVEEAMRKTPDVLINWRDQSDE